MPLRYLRREERLSEWSGERDEMNGCGGALTGRHESYSCGGTSSGQYRMSNTHTHVGWRLGVSDLFLPQHLLPFRLPLSFCIRMYFFTTEIRLSFLSYPLSLIPSLLSPPSPPLLTPSPRPLSLLSARRRTLSPPEFRTLPRPSLRSSQATSR